jgi:hypothetical protein
MEKFAARRIQKLEEKRKELEESNKNDIEPISDEKRIEFNRIFGLPEMPTNVYAVGRNNSAAVWWNDEGDELVEWEIHRYRRDDVETDLWNHKGFIQVKYLKRIRQVVYDGLTNGHEVSSLHYHYPLINYFSV